MRRIIKKWHPASFADKVRGVVARIPRGSMLTYGEVARRAGSAGAARAVGNIMKANVDPRVPCHRVVPAEFRKNGNVGNYNRGGAKRKLAILKREGVIK